MHKGIVCIHYQIIKETIQGIALHPFFKSYRVLQNWIECHFEPEASGEKSG